MKGNFISLETFLSFGYVYVTVVVGFGIIYMLFAFSGRPLLIETAASRNDNIFETCFYFSAMTLFSVGHGDVIPQGAGRIITVLEALIGYTLPAAFVARAVIDRGRS
jgi:potassium channel LctB